MCCQLTLCCQQQNELLGVSYGQRIHCEDFSEQIVKQLGRKRSLLQLLEFVHLCVLDKLQQLRSYFFRVGLYLLEVAFCFEPLPQFGNGR
jgi:hypothetical protein